MYWKSATLSCLMLGATVTGLIADEKVIVEGCPVPGTEMNCLVLRGRDNVTYDISAAKPRPAIGRAVHLTGTKSSRLGICQQGIILDDIRWSYTEEKCQ